MVRHISYLLTTVEVQELTLLDGNSILITKVQDVPTLVLNQHTTP